MNATGKDDFQPDALLELLSAVADDRLEAANRQELFATLRQDPTARAAYIEHAILHALLIRKFRRSSLDSILPGFGSAAVAGPPDIEDGCVSAPAMTPLGFLGDASQGVIGYFSSGWPVAYLVATVILVLGLLVGAITHVSQPMQVAHDSPPATQGQVLPERGINFVGRITGMVDCQWADPNTAVPGPVAVPLGRKYALASGLMEITYNSGAKVVLQGPVTYEVESATGGFLSVGKLTAKVEKKAESGKRKADSPLSTLHSPLFAVRTPTATVTDLGTEFGVEVAESGGTSARVFQGVVEVQPIVRDGQQGHAVRLAENETVSVDRDADGQPLAVRRATGKTQVFVRVGELPKLVEELRLKPFRRWQAYSEELRRDSSLVAYYDFQQRPGLPTLLPNVAANGDRTLDGIVENATWSNGRMPGKHALRFNGVDQHVQITVPRKLDDVTLAAWVYVESLHDLCNGLLMSHGRSANDVHWQLRANDGSVGIGIGKDNVHIYQTVPTFDRRHLSQWRHLAVVYDHTAMRVRLYVDGQVTDETPIKAHAPFCLGPAWIGHWKFGDFKNPDLVRNLNGKIDELVIFGRPLRSDEIQRMFLEGGVSIGELRSTTKSVGPDQPQRPDVEKR